MSTLQVNQEGILDVFLDGNTQLNTIRAPDGGRWDLLASGVTGALTATDGSTGEPLTLILFDENLTPWEVRIDNGGVLTVESFDKDIVLAPAVNSPVTIDGLPAVGYELYVTDSITGLGALTYKNGLFLETQPSPILLNDFGLPADPIYIEVGATYTFKMIPPGGGAAIKEWEYVVGGIPLKTSTATEWGNPISCSYQSATSIAIQGDVRATFHIARRVRVNDASFIYGVVSAVNYDGVQTLITLKMDGTTMTPVLTSVNPALLTPRASTIPSRRYAGDVSVFSGNVSIPVAKGLNLLPVGTMALYPNSGILPVPSGWLQCNGQAVSRSTFAELFAAVGTTYGAGNGTTTFNLPTTSAVATHLVYYIYAKG